MCACIACVCVCVSVCQCVSVCVGGDEDVGHVHDMIKQTADKQTGDSRQQQTADKRVYLGGDEHMCRVHNIVNRFDSIPTVQCGKAVKSQNQRVSQSW